MNAQAFAQTLWGAIGFGGASESSKPFGISLEEAVAILGRQNVFNQDAYVRVFGTRQTLSRMPDQVPFSGKQLKRLHSASYGKLRLFVRYASLQQVIAATKTTLDIDQIVLDLVPDDERTAPRIPMYRLVSSGLLQKEEADLRKSVKDFGLDVANASVTTGVTAVLLQTLRAGQPMGYQSLGRKTTRQVIVGVEAGKVSVHLAQTVRTFPSILEFRART